MAVYVEADRLMLDVSLFLTEQGVTWLQEQDRIKSRLVVSAAFSEALPTLPDDVLLRFADRDQRDFLSYAREVLPRALEGVERFSYREIRSLPRTHERVRRRLLENETVEGEVLADEFVYLVTQSWLLAKTRRMLDELKRAGVRVRE